jgi:hypothetical protein
MPRTTLNIEAPILRELKKLQRAERRSLGRIVSQLLAEVLASRRAAPSAAQLQWVSRPMHARVNLADTEALYDVLDRRDE